MSAGMASLYFALALLQSGLAASLDLKNPVPLFDINGEAMDAHDGNIRQWEADGPFYYYAMSYSRCFYHNCTDPKCGHLATPAQKVGIWKSKSLSNRSWEYIGDALPATHRPEGTYFRPHVAYNGATKRWVLIVNFRSSVSAGSHWVMLAATATSPEGPFADIQQMSNLTFQSSSSNFGDFDFFADKDGAAYLAYNVMGRGIFVEKLNRNFTDGAKSGISKCVSCSHLGPGAQESPSMYRTASGTYVILTAGATCFGLPQPNGGRWGGTGIFAYASVSGPLGPYSFHGNMNNVDHNVSSGLCQTCEGESCPYGHCALPVQLNSILRRWDGAPIALSASLWALNVFNQTTHILGNFAEYWQPWEEVVDSRGLPKPLAYLSDIVINTGSKPGPRLVDSGISFV